MGSIPLTSVMAGLDPSIHEFPWRLAIGHHLIKEDFLLVAKNPQDGILMRGCVDNGVYRDRMC